MSSTAESTTAAGWTSVWEFTVRAECRADFEHHYGNDGSWARLFRRAPGYLGTWLLADRATPGRYLTVDRWRDHAAYLAFRSAHADAYAALDRDCEQLTETERALGEFSG